MKSGVKAGYAAIAPKTQSIPPQNALPRLSWQILQTPFYVPSFFSVSYAGPVQMSGACIFITEPAAWRAVPARRA
ncbi:hypothetical protein AtDm6_0799 [Acetobacter tropicalis]|uniref:Uncharacterized protein n=1 Tax=Acetobacter tropicalis TaxID=104102 RepID=A0A095B8L4_9PROT|nr:hypothetical protein AtDm6_0799 [Acetobacter tropicalis]